MTRIEAEVITLSDDDDDDCIAIEMDPIIVPPREKKATPLFDGENNQQKATAHISTSTNRVLTMEELGMKRLTDVYQQHRRERTPVQSVQSRPDAKNNLTLLMKTIGASSNLENSSSSCSSVPPSLPYAPRAHLNVHQSSSAPPVSAPRASRRRRSSPVPLSSSGAPTSSRTRGQNQSSSVIPTIYHGHYMFEATESYEHSRRSTRFNTKKIDGKFVCSYNPSKCQRMFGSMVEIVNHVWAHVVHDPPPSEAPKPQKTAEGLILVEGSGFVLSENSAISLKRMRTCEHCNATFNTVFNKQQHVVRCHLEQDGKEFVCNICETDLQEPVKMVAHMNKHISGESPYHCRKCKYRTSVRSFFYQHFVEKHSNDALLCPICLFQEDLKPSTRRTKHIFIRSFVEHMRAHATEYQYRCQACALSFNSQQQLYDHRTADHTLLNPLWQVRERKTVHEKRDVKLTRKNKISLLQKRFLAETEEGKRICDEVSCSGGALERRGFDCTNTGSALFVCACGHFKSFNGNRAASHVHRCRRKIRVGDSKISSRTEPHTLMQDIERDRGVVLRSRTDPEKELELFAIYPPFSSNEIDPVEEELQREGLNLKKYKLCKDVIEFHDWDDLLLVKMMSNENSETVVQSCIDELVG